MMPLADSPVTTAPEKRPARQDSERTVWQSVPRGVAVFWGVFLLLQVLMCGESFTIWWLGEMPLPGPLQRGASALYGMLLLYYGWSENEPRPVRTLTWIVTGLLLGYTLYLVFDWFSRAQLGAIRTPTRIPFVLQISGMLAVMFAGLSQPRDADHVRQGGLLYSVIAFDLCLIALPISHLFCEGRMTDAVRAESVVIFVDELQPPDAVRLSAIEDTLAAAPGTHLYLVGNDSQLSLWKDALAREAESASSLQVHTIQAMIHRDPPRVTELVSLMEQESDNRRVVLIGHPLQLAEQRIRMIRSGWQPTQLALESTSLTLSSAFRSLPDLWLTYLPLRG
jgi:hypothetical protein